MGVAPSSPTTAVEAGLCILIRYCHHPQRTHVDGNQRGERRLRALSQEAIRLPTTARGIVAITPSSSTVIKFRVRANDRGTSAPTDEEHGVYSTAPWVNKSHNCGVGSISGARAAGQRDRSLSLCWGAPRWFPPIFWVLAWLPALAAGAILLGRSRQSDVSW